MFGDAASAIAPLAMLAAGKPNGELEKAKSSLKSFLDGQRKTKPSKKHLQLLENNNIISKKVEETGGKKKIDRLNKAQKWSQFSVDNLNSALDLGAKAKMITGAKKGSSKWIQFVKLYAAKNGITYKEALSLAGPEFKKLSGGNFNPAF